MQIYFETNKTQSVREISKDLYSMIYQRFCGLEEQEYLQDLRDQR